MPQLLRAHEMMEYVYNVADVAYPVSIRDQMNRACWLVAKAQDLGFVVRGQDVFDSHRPGPCGCHPIDPTPCSRLSYRSHQQRRAKEQEQQNTSFPTPYRPAGAA